MANLKRLRFKRQSSGIACLALALASVTAAPVARTDAPDVYAIKDARIVTGAGRTIAKGTVVIRDGLITDVGENAKIPADARVIEGAGLTVYPGLIDGYTHAALSAPEPAGAARQGAPPGSQMSLTPQAQEQRREQALGDPSDSAADQVRPGGATLENLQAVGVTAALTSPRQGIFAGRSALVNLAGESAAKMVVRAPVALTVQFTTVGGFGGGYPSSLMGTVSYIRQTFYDAIRYRDEAARYEKVKRGVPRPEHDRRLAALLPALRGELPVLFVANSDGDIRRALRIADEFKLRPIIAGALEGYRVADLLKAKNAPVILSVDFPKRAADLPEDVEESLRELRERADAPKGAARLAQAGVKFAFTAGSLKPQDFIANVRKAVENGLPKEEALRALTVNAAEIFGVSDQLGTIETGKIANLTVTSGDLFAKDAKVRYLFIDGEQVDIKKPEAPRPGGERAAAPGATVNPAGTWNLIVKLPQGDMNVTLNLQREGEQFTGTMTAPMGTTAIDNVTLTGNQLRFITTLHLGDPVQATVAATIEGDTMEGTITVPDRGSFEFTGTRPR
ncbi:MAG TPA: amidohydrolase family protein [Blastocatellia bacterium]|nr:amidohydrolase family protein [Blastocatellia bacterium]